MSDLINTKKWYMISTMSGKEDKVFESLQNRIVSEQLQDVIEEIHIFKEPRITKKELLKKEAGEPHKVKMVNMYVGYIFIKMIMTDEAWFIIRNTQYVTGLIGSSGKGAKPTPVSSREMKKMFNKEKQAHDDFENGIIKTEYIPGAFIRIINGPFSGTEVKILKSDDVIKKVIVEIETFGRLIEYEFDFKDIELID
ncbi:transcription termination/antitermination protein NusG [Mycoplasma phocimorsus]|uniref:Transcription termination/antitermination protein NusG n=1 Tax=Mycoplasma phocimorsus TaxID=3045839 RepID=A0AAJ1UX65_9MOLU|nr:transcription termination/antitermination protein NusG [Mycoplasma phocimorsus]MDJ1646045.1 transcription termination/antitermination protein NusG [Mycoplasma phocimorsus]MDJ1646349.1 transcription termination/antitermination protein NusG [Mycoplasma phocimorsus]MDJ1647086.1 transcription termination/antitermination protein NusG [Mycoplasma phocimorsus]MDJ1647526.1 transcription termination/antitermination protein NusG [Mycoplasma phocimorsus]MDJ1648144.1 transcription termination/antitermi